MITDQRRVRATQARLRQLGAIAPTDLAALALMFEDDAIADDGTVAGRLQVILAATERRSVPGLHTAIPFSDSGFRGDRKPGGAGFRDPWASSRNQVGHFLTAVRLQAAPGVVSRPLPLLGSVRALVGAPQAMADAEVALRLAIGHEKATDPPDGMAAAMAALEAGLAAYKAALAQELVGATVWRRVLAAIGAEAVRQVALILGAFRAQFKATSARDMAAWREALRLISGPGIALDRTTVRRALEGPRSPLRSIRLGSGEGNSLQDLRLTLIGWRLGQLIGSGAFTDRREVAAWLRRTLGEG